MFYRNCGVAPVEGNKRKFGFINWLDGNSEQLFANCQPTVSPLSAYCLPIVGWQSTDRQPTVFFGNCSSLLPTW